MAVFGSNYVMRTDERTLAVKEVTIVNIYAHDSLPSSSTQIGGSFSMTRAIAQRCFWPPLEDYSVYDIGKGE